MLFCTLFLQQLLKSAKNVNEFVEIEEQQRLMDAVENFLHKQLKGKPFHAIIAIEISPANGFEFSVGTISSRSALESWKVIMTGLSRGIEGITEGARK